MKAIKASLNKGLSNLRILIKKVTLRNQIFFNMIQTSKIIGTVLATRGLLGAGVGIGAILGFVLYESNLLFSMSANIPISLLLSVVPIVTYVNSDLEKETIIVVNKGKSGIYR
jgi:hypothetical protein